MNLLILVKWWNELNLAEQIFWTISIIFSVLFVIQLISSIIGIEFDSDVPEDMEVGDSDAHFGVDHDFTIFSIRSIIAFFTFFGWVGVIALNSGMSLTLTILLSFISGVIALFFVAFVLYQLVKMAEEGTVDIEDVLGKYGKVYVPVPAKRDGSGLVNIELSNKVMELRAVTDGDLLPTGTIIYVLKILQDNILLVGEIKEKNIQ